MTSDEAQIPSMSPLGSKLDVLRFEFFLRGKYIRCVAVSKSLLRIACFGNKNRKRGIFSVQVLFVQTLTQCNAAIQTFKFGLR